jgi:acyl carrier protein
MTGVGLDLPALAATAVGDVLDVPAEQLRSASSLFDLPGFDSVAIVGVLDRLEEAIGAEVPPELIVPDAFESLESLTHLLANALGGKE